MFLEIDHIALTSTIDDDVIQSIELLGYQKKFLNKNVTNSKIKQSLLTKFFKTHDIALFKKKNSFGIELIDHGIIRKTEPHIIPVFQNLSKKMIKKTTKNKIKGIGTEVISKLFDFPVFIKKENSCDDLIFNEIILNTNKLKESTKFWQNLEFKLSSSSQDFSSLKFHSILNNTEYTINLRKIRKNSEYFLNDKGFSCIAMITNSALKEKELLCQKGILTSDIDTILLNHQLLNIFFAKGPSGEIVEIFSIKK